MSSISAAEHPKSFVEVHGKRMAYVELGSGPPIVFLHGNPTSSYLWRNIMPHLTGLGRAIAPDLIGMGDSDKLDDPGPESYRFVEHRHYLDGFLDAIVPDGPIVFVIQDWGSALGFDWARRHPERVRGLCFFEAIVAPVESWDDWPDDARAIFQGFRSAAGEEMVLQNNIFIERVLPASNIRKLSDEEMAVYRRPFTKAGEDRRPTLTWPRQIPIAGEPADVVKIVSDYQTWLAASEVPKLFINAQPGAILGDKQRKIVRAWPSLTEKTVPGVHFVQEDSPHEIGQALKDWIPTLAV